MLSRLELCLLVCSVRSPVDVLPQPVYNFGGFEPLVLDVQWPALLQSRGQLLGMRAHILEELRAHELHELGNVAFLALNDETPGLASYAHARDIQTPIAGQAGDDLKTVDTRNTSAIAFVEADEGAPLPHEASHDFRVRLFRRRLRCLAEVGRGIL